MVIFLLVVYLIVGAVVCTFTTVNDILNTMSIDRYNNMNDVVDDYFDDLVAYICMFLLLIMWPCVVLVNIITKIPKTIIRKMLIKRINKEKKDD